MAYAPVPQCDLYDGVAVGKGCLGSFLVIGGDGCGGVVFPALDDVESPDVKAGAREFAGKVGQGTGLVQQLHQYSGGFRRWDLETVVRTGLYGSAGRRTRTPGRTP